MKLAIIGYGKMGKEIEKLARERHHEVTCIIDIDNRHQISGECLRTAEVAIEFTSPASAVDNILFCFEAGISVVSGTTGWLDRYAEVEEACRKHDVAFLHASNFNPGMNIFSWLNRELATRMNSFPHYEVEIDETHHVQKIDAPSGTAIMLANEIIASLSRKSRWVLDNDPAAGEIRIRAFREGTVPGIHTVRYESDADIIEIRHSAKSRRGLAMGAIMAAEFIRGKTGCFTLKDVLHF